MPPVFDFYKKVKKDVSRIGWLLLLLVFLQIVMGKLTSAIYPYIPINLNAYKGIRFFVDAMYDIYCLVDWQKDLAGYLERRAIRKKFLV